ncbi:MAG: hypothetical protein ETSY1_37400, partial [Candidatus Entotheonella factor]
MKGEGDKMRKKYTSAVIICLVMFFIVSQGLAEAKRYGLGTMATPEQIAGWDIDIRPDGQGLPPGEGTFEEGEAIFLERCASCHGEFGEAFGRYPVLVGGEESLTSQDPVKTIGSYWPYATTVFDYVRRAMPFGAAQTLTDDETYAVTAFLLNMNDIIEEDFVLNQDNLPTIQMPNHDGFIVDGRPDVPTGEPCMKDCKESVKIIGKARQLDVTPEADRATTVAALVLGAEAEQVSRGQDTFNQCRACHTLTPGEHKVGPSLHGVFGRKAGALADFPRYSAAMQQSEVVWDDAGVGT